MCQLCDFKRDMNVLQSTLNLLNTVDFENFLALTELIENMIYTIESSDEADEMVQILKAPEDCDVPFVVAMRMLTPIVEMLQSSTIAANAADEIVYDILKDGLDGIGSSEEDEYPDPPTAFTKFFDGDDGDE